MSLNVPPLPEDLPSKPFAVLSKTQKEAYPRYVVRTKTYPYSDWAAQYSIPACPAAGAPARAEAIAARLLASGKYAEVEIV